MLDKLKVYHFSPAKMVDETSENIFTLYIKRLDPNKQFFIQSDIDVFEAYKTRLDDQL